jgi:hypothetical protein
MYNDSYEKLVADVLRERLSDYRQNRHRDTLGLRSPDPLRPAPRLPSHHHEESPLEIGSDRATMASPW